MPEKSTIASKYLSVSAREQTEDRGVQVHVLAAGEVTVEPGAELQQGREPAAPLDQALGRAEDAADDLEQRRLARSRCGRSGRADVPEAISRSMLRSAQNSVLCCCVERALTSRSLSDLFALSENLLLTSETRMTVVMDQSS